MELYERELGLCLEEGADTGLFAAVLQVWFYYVISKEWGSIAVLNYWQRNKDNKWVKVWIQKENDQVNEQVDERIYAMVVGECMAKWMSEE